MFKFISELWLLFIYNLKLTLREPVWVIFGLFQPICWLLLFGPLLENVVTQGSGSNESMITVFTSGICVMMGIFGTLFVGFRLVSEIRSGVVERFRVSPVSRVAPLLARSLRDAFVLMFQVTLLLLMASTMNLKANITGVLLSMLIVLIMGIALSSVSYALALLFKSEDALASTINFFSQPILLLSGILIPLSQAPAWEKTIASFNPLLYIVDATRSLFNGIFQSNDVLYGVISVSVLTFVSLFWATNAFRKATS